MYRRIFNEPEIGGITMLKKIITIFTMLTVLFSLSTAICAATIDDTFTNIVGTYSIGYGSETSNSILNCKAAAKSINGTVLEPGDEFSFNDIVGERTAERGYREGTIISNGQFTKGVGGGICMLSTCIFNAALESNFKITDRQNHGLKVSYAPYGRDAMINWGTSDLKFVNNYNVPIMISISICDNTMTVNLLSDTKLYVPNAKVKTRLIKGAYYTYRYIGYDINYVTKSIYKNN